MKKEPLTQVFSCEFCEISKNTICHRTPLVAASQLLHDACRCHIEASSLFAEQINEWTDFYLIGTPVMKE